MNRYPLAQRIFLELLPDAKLRIVDAGAAGAGETHRWGFLGRNLELHGFEADEKECRNLLSLAPPGAQIRYHNVFLGRSQKSRKFYIAREFNNSFYPTDYAWFKRRRSSWTGTVVRQSDAFEIVKTIDVESVNLDDWTERTGVSGVDYLKVDIEGAELELMQASPRTMSGVLGVSVDVTFHADWIGAPTFADVDRWMVAEGFVLFEMNGIKRGTLYDTPIVAPRGHSVLMGQLACANAIYFRDPLVEGAPKMDAEAMLKLAAIAEVNGQVEFAFELLRAVGRSADSRFSADVVATVEGGAEAEYRKMLASEKQARWRNRIAAAARTVLPASLRKHLRRVAEKVGLGANPLFP